MKFSARTLVRGMKYWPPFLGAGIRLKSLSEDFRDAVVEMKLGRLNRNAVGTHFGGSLYAMTDPFFAIMLMHNLGREYLVWDKAGEIEYVSPGRGTVAAHFHLSHRRIEEIRAQAAGGGKIFPEFEVSVKDQEGAIVARVKKTLYVRLKPRHRPASEKK
jgi:acyl-coenzyme A thioesterase PaaI-like protein